MYKTSSKYEGQKAGRNIMFKVYLLIKRCFDILLSLISIVFLSPILLTVAILVKLTSKGPILFIQKRVGINNEPFYIFKFRTMRVDAPKDQPTDQLENPLVWITRVGLILRKTSIDELPQLVNIFLGNMSFVGPRPAIYSQIGLIDSRTKLGVSRIKPGLTGLAQVNGRDENNDSEKVYWDEIYLKEMSFLLDIKIILQTFLNAISSKSVIEGKH